jgi:putative component of membrane protein insertase Oxa1/YidC/SpoIIIJ protein YidD
MRFNVFCFVFLCLTSHTTARALFEEPWGRDSDLKAPSVSLEQKKTSFATRVADKIIRFHQEVLSPVDGPRSSFRPTSSRYMQLAMQRYGFIKGFVMGCDRLLRENDESWVYHTVEIDGKKFKFDPAVENKYLPFTP